MRNLGLVMASLAGATGGSIFDLPSFCVSGFVSPRALGKRHDTSWRKSKRAKSMKRRANGRKAKRRSKDKRV